MLVTRPATVVYSSKNYPFFVTYRNFSTNWATLSLTSNLWGYGYVSGEPLSSCTMADLFSKQAVGSRITYSFLPFLAIYSSFFRAFSSFSLASFSAFCLLFSSFLLSFSPPSTSTLASASWGCSGSFFSGWSGSIMINNQNIAPLSPNHKILNIKENKLKRQQTGYKKYQRIVDSFLQHSNHNLLQICLQFSRMLQTKKEKAQNRTSLEEDLFFLENPDRRLFTFEQLQAEKVLQESYQPGTIIQRDQEMKKIQHFIWKALEKKQSKESLYISGVPGIGKTLCVSRVMDKVTEKYKKSFKYVYINSMKIKKAHDIFRLLYVELTSPKERKTQIETAMFLLDDLFRKGIELEDYKGLPGTMKILVIDEIDYLLTKDQDVLYNLFDWTQSEKSRLAIIGISNTIHFPESLKGKIISRIGNTRLVFKPYSFDQIEKILRQRVENLGIFQEKALEFISKKIAKCSSDIRKCLRILREALYEHSKQNKHSHSYSKISYGILNRVYELVYENPFTQMYLSMPSHYKKILKILANHFKKQNYSVCFRDLCSQASNLAKLDSPSVKEIVLNLNDMNLISVRYSKNSHASQFENRLKNLDEMHVSLKIDLDRILYAANKQDVVDIIIE